MMLDVTRMLDVKFACQIDVCALHDDGEKTSDDKVAEKAVLEGDRGLPAVLLCGVFQHVPICAPPSPTRSGFVSLRGVAVDHDVRLHCVDRVVSVQGARWIRPRDRHAVHAVGRGRRDGHEFLPDVSAHVRMARTGVPAS